MNTQPFGQTGKMTATSPVPVTSPSDFAPASSKEFLDIQATIECERSHRMRQSLDRQ